MHELPRRVTFAGHDVPVDNPDVHRRISTWYNFYLSKPWQIVLWLERAHRFFPIIEESLVANDLPEDLKYLAVVESNLQPRAVSSADAEGIWQFTHDTAESFGLEITPLIDERGDVFTATEAAVQFLERAHADLEDSWVLASAAFNAGIDGIRSRVARQNTDDYWQMVFPPETEDYVPKAIAVKLIMENAHAFGLSPEHPLSEIRRVSIRVPDKPVYLSDIASFTGTSFREVWEANSHIGKPYLPPGEYALVFTTDSGRSADEVQAHLADRPYSRREYQVAESDTLETISEAVEVSVDELRAFNDLESSDTLTPGETVTYWR
ncbi:MAG: transglycosylase SLT domain-containing protein [Spirochaetaceae bacterium]